MQVTEDKRLAFIAKGISWVVHSVFTELTEIYAASRNATFNSVQTLSFAKTLYAVAPAVMVAVA